MTLDTDEPMRMNTFEISGELAARLKDGVLEEGMRVRVECRAETIEMVNLENGETSDEDRAVVTRRRRPRRVSLARLGARGRAPGTGGVYTRPRRRRHHPGA